MLIMVGLGGKPGGPREKEGRAGGVPWRPGGNSSRARREALRPQREGR